MRALLVANPAATTTTAKVRDVLVRALSSDLKVDVAETTHRGHAHELGAQATADGMDVVVTLGGDGTVNETVNGMLADGPGAHVPTLAVVPGGSTNVVARALGRSRDPVEATAEILDSLRAGRTRRISLGTASAQVATATDIAWGPGWTPPRWFVFSAGLGFDADVIRRVEEQRARGRRSSGSLYVRAGTRAFLLGPDRRRPSMTLRVPGQAPVERPVPLPGRQRQPVDLPRRPAHRAQPGGGVRHRAGRVRDGPGRRLPDAPDAAHRDERPAPGRGPAGAPPARPGRARGDLQPSPGMAAGR